MMKVSHELAGLLTSLIATRAASASAISYWGLGSRRLRRSIALGRPGRSLVNDLDRGLRFLVGVFIVSVSYVSRQSRVLFC